MSNDTKWAIVLLLPPALFGLMIAVDSWKQRLRRRTAQSRHPSARTLPRCGDCGAEMYDQRVHWRYCAARDVIA